MSDHGAPCWYELCTADPAASQAFYGPVLGWTFQDAGMEGFSYGLAMAGETMVAGVMDPGQPMPEFWMIYFAVADADATCERVAALGGVVHRPPADIPGTGRFAILADPQGAAFGVLQPLPGQMGGAYDPSKPGHGNWNELSTSDPAAGLAFYAEVFGWQASRAMDMGPMGTYQLIAREGADFGGIMGPRGPGIPPHWLPYFGVPGMGAAQAAIGAAGGTVLHGPAPVPGGAQILVAQDGRGVHFAVVGPGASPEADPDAAAGG